jgi:CRP-like cAMP-binding protein
LAKGDLGKVYSDGEVLCKQGETGDHMYVIQSGRVEVFASKNGGEIRLATLGEGDIIGEMAIFAREPRSATVRALGEVRALTVDRKNLLRRISEDPSMAFRVIQLLTRRVRELNDEVVKLTPERSPG